MAKLESARLKAEAEAQAKAQAKEEIKPKAGSLLLAGPKVPDFRGKAVVAVLRESTSLGMPVEISGRGTAKHQFPAPGTVLPAGAHVRVEFTPVP